MKVSGPTGPSQPQGQRPARAGGGFNLPAATAGSGAAATSAASSVASLSGVSALMALQGVEDPTERKRRAIRRGSGLLDRLDELKMSLLAGQDGTAALSRLAQSLREERPETDSDTGLKAVLDQIELRAAVEMAKGEISRSRV
ncbi:flagellar assembly protein FliX [Brevundimonas vesicularis]|uniref:flagellar assembly protein FliX n=1 Tax=Brevundimonas vesicularis TaxID=41276 RepID=UPI0038D4CE14